VSNRPLLDRLPSPFALFREDSTIRAIVDAIDAEGSRRDDEVEQVRKSLRIADAEGQSLDLIGDEFGPLGVRRGRDDDPYRAVLTSLVPAFDGRGTGRGVRLAVSLGVLSTPDDVALIEDFAAQEYEVVLLRGQWEAHRSGVVRELAELADPAAVRRRDPVQNRLEAADLALDFGETTAATVASGLSSAELEPLSTDGFVLSG
jgi:hypothetical protein